ncbi:COX15/CtaA family protein [soil metagenome]
MQNISATRNSKLIAIWLLTGVAMIIIQIVLGGITRLTESGLSITEWNPITGVLPPLNHNAWMAEFDKYKNTDQFRYIHADFSLSDFKFIFFWEWFHRLWARLLAVVFLIGFIYFLIRRMFSKEMIAPMIILFLLGAMQGLVGWIMVESGLVPEKMFVGHIQLTTHFIAALVLLAYTFWFALKLLIVDSSKIFSRTLKNLTVFILVIITIQLIYGGFMSGLKAATAAPTWPDINGSMMPTYINDLTSWSKNLINNKFMVQFIHRTLAYVLTIVILVWWVKSRKNNSSPLFIKVRALPLLLVIIQVILGILTLIRSPYGNNLLWLGIAHQFTGMLLLLSIILMLYIIRSKRSAEM